MFCATTINMSRNSLIFQKKTVGMLLLHSILPHYGPKQFWQYSDNWNVSLIHSTTYRCWRLKLKKKSHYFHQVLGHLFAANSPRLRNNFLTNQWVFMNKNITTSECCKIISRWEKYQEVSDSSADSAYDKKLPRILIQYSYLT